MIPPILPTGSMPTWDEQCDVKCLAVELTRLALAGDYQGMADLMPSNPVDAANVIGTLAVAYAAAITAKVGADPEARRKWFDTDREVIKRGRGM